MRCCLWQSGRFFLPREFGQLTFIVVYVPGPNNNEAAEVISDMYNDALSRSPDQSVFVLGDLNTCQLAPHLPSLQQYINTPTRASNILDQCFGNIPDAFKAVSRPPLGKSDHNVIHLLPMYRQLVKRIKPHTKTVQEWTKDAEEQLQDCFEITDWSLFFEESTDPDMLSDTISFYINFCEDVAVKTKSVRIFSNNKPWLTKELKHCLNDKKAAFLNGDRDLVKQKEKEFRRKVFNAKLDFKNKIEQRFCSGNAKQAWEGLNTMMGRERKKHFGVITEDWGMFVNNLHPTMVDSMCVTPHQAVSTFTISWAAMSPSS